MPSVASFGPRFALHAARPVAWGQFCPSLRWLPWTAFLPCIDHRGRSQLRPPRTGRIHLPSFQFPRSQPCRLWDGLTMALAPSSEPSPLSPLENQSISRCHRAPPRFQEVLSAAPVEGTRSLSCWHIPCRQLSRASGWADGTGRGDMSGAWRDWGARDGLALEPVWVGDLGTGSGGGGMVNRPSHC